MKYPIVLQHSEEDCGAACIATIAKHHGRTFAISRVREAVGTGARGTTLLGLNRGAEALGFNARQVASLQFKIINYQFKMITSCFSKRLEIRKIFLIFFRSEEYYPT